MGGSIGVDRLVSHLVTRATPTLATAALFIAVATAAARRYALLTAQMLRAQGVSTAIDVAEQSLKNQLKHAHRGGYLWVAIVGDEEMQSETVTLRNMQTGVEQKGIASKVLPMMLPA